MLSRPRNTLAAAVVCKTWFYLFLFFRFVDVGVYGPPKREGFDAVKTTRAVEDFVRRVNGYQMMYADSYMTKEEFRAMFDHTLYDEMRERYQCKEAFPDVYDKVNKKARAGTAKQ